MLDVVLCVVAGVLVLPLIAIVVVAVRGFIGSPTLYRDERAGISGRPITILKFRTMSDATDASGRLLPDDDRLSVFGRMLRRTSLDELPQLLSVLVGDMSLVGPRPLPMRYVSRYNPRQAARLLVKPGLTGWAQIHGRNSVEWTKRLELDVCYVEMLSRPAAIFTDIGIISSTCFQVIGQAFTGRGIAAPGVATMQEFQP